MRNNPEREIEIAILEYLQVQQIKSWKVNVKGFFNPTRGHFQRSNHPYDLKGQPDITGILPDGKILLIEVKTPKGRLSEDQKHFIEWVKESNGVVIIARSVDEVEKDLIELGYI